jgi:hypothetical protein
MHKNLRFIRSVQVSNHHGPDRNGNTDATILEFSLEWLISIQSLKKNIQIRSKRSRFYYFGLKITPIAFLQGA